ncbi:MAG: hemerythrin domain-containing protein [Chloroflexota bacterium]
MKAVEVLRAEHDGVLIVLAELERAATAAEYAAPMPRGIFTDIQEFFSVFVDRCHHGKEEAEVFPGWARVCMRRWSRRLPRSTAPGGGLNSNRNGIYTASVL